jgi:hypothetical protein
MKPYFSDENIYLWLSNKAKPYIKNVQETDTE